ncbi:MAG TPA: hypothetical protein VGP22_04565 [Albitalea sp.]|jgi:hypothetical protein|nr:hypothetical protein [Albitalea sp.]
MARVETTDQQLREAYEQRRRADWPPTYEEVMEHPVYGRVVQMHACHAAAIEHVTHLEVVAPEAPPPRGTVHARAPQTLRVPKQKPFLDRKRAASGDRDDDE